MIPASDIATRLPDRPSLPEFTTIFLPPSMLSEALAPHWRVGASIPRHLDHHVGVALLTFGTTKKPGMSLDNVSHIRYRFLDVTFHVSLNGRYHSRVKGIPQRNFFIFLGEGWPQVRVSVFSKISNCYFLQKFLGVKT